MIYMKILLFILVALSCRMEGREICNPEKGDYSGYVLISVMPNNVADAEYLQQLGRKKVVCLWNVDTQFMVGNKNLMYFKRCKLNYLKKAFKKRNMETIVASDNLQRLINHHSYSYMTNLWNASLAEFDYAQYHQFDSIELFLKLITTKYEDVTKLEIFGESYEKRPLYAVEISMNDGNLILNERKKAKRKMKNTITRSKIGQKRKRMQSTEQNQKQIILINCGMHAREWAGISFCLYFINALITGFKEGEQDYVNVLRKYDFIIIPVINPDGYTYAVHKDRFWRKTRSRTEGSSCLGVDLNRNFYNPGNCDDNDPCAEIYCGEKPLSEPEAAALKNLLEKRKGKLKGFFDIHCYGQFWLIPWAKTATKPKHYDEMMRVVEIGKKALEKRFQTQYTIGTASDIMYPCDGTGMDYVYEKGFANYSFSLELRDKGQCMNGECGFLLPLDKIIPTSQETADGILAAVMAMK